MKQHFTFEGHVNRKSFWLNQLAIFGVFFVSFFIFGFIAGAGGSDQAVGVAALISIPALIAAVVSGWSYLARRVRDTGNSAWLALLVAIPYVGIVPWLYFAFTSKSITNGTLEVE